MVSAVCTSILTTVGRTTASEAAVLERINQAGSLTLTVTDVSPAGGHLPLSLVETVNGLSAVEWAVGLSAPVDARRAALGAGSSPVPTWRLVGSVPWLPEITVGMETSTRGLIAERAQTTVGFVGPYGVVEAGSAVPISLVGPFVPPSSLQDLGVGIIVPFSANKVASLSSEARGNDPDTSLDQPTLRRLVAVAGSAQVAAEMERLVMRLIGEVPGQDLRVDSPTAIADLHNKISGDLGGSKRQITLGVLGIGLLMVSAVVFGETLTRRRDIGRARALGASRGYLLGQLVTRSIICAVPGVVVGVVAGLVTLGGSNMPNWRFTVATAVLSILTAAVAVLVPGVVAVRRDPVAVLRTP